jgi:hypothetical protein
MRIHYLFIQNRAARDVGIRFVYILLPWLPSSNIHSLDSRARGVVPTPSLVGESQIQVRVSSYIFYFGMLPKVADAS